MDIATRSPHLRPKAPRIVLMILCVIAVGALSQCKLTPDKVTGVANSLSQDVKAKNDNRGNCVSDCAHRANDAMDLEKSLHQQNVKACNGNPACLAAEEARHDAALIQIQTDRQHCIDGCHHQGGGHGH